MGGVARGRRSECAAPGRGEGECVLEGPRERCAETWRGSFVRSFATGHRRVDRVTDLKHRVEISVTLSKKDQKKAWLGMTTYEARRPQ